MTARVIRLEGTWSIATRDGRIRADYAVPGDVHSALIAAGTIPHPYQGRNEYSVRWVAEEDWIASRTFQFAGDRSGSWYLDLDYLDTVADVTLNGVVVLEACNCFRRYRRDVSAHLREGLNTIEILFHSNVRRAAELQAQQPFYIPYALQNCPIPHGNMLRKPACDFGWDWNLAIVPFGLHGAAALKQMSSARVEHVQVHQTHASDGSVTLDVCVTVAGHKAASVELAAAFDGQRAVRVVQVRDGESVHRFTFTVAAPKLWWPAGSGGQPLYDLTVDLEGNTVRRRIGLRHVELVTTPDEAGARFTLRVNGREIFCRGANWIPADALPSAATGEITRKLLRAAVDANMNMVRVWGGGTYEKEFFYDACDELGLLVWQDFMFSCNLYPSTDEFLGEVRQEVDYQVRRLGSHASLALWCGDNELIGALTWFEESRKNRDRYLVNYDRLNRVVEGAMRAADDRAIWWPSSPSPGILSFGDAWHDDRSGDMHFWSVWHEGKSFAHYRDVKPRFCSEFGFQSFPSLAIARQFATSEDDLNIASPVMESHQKNAGGNARIAETMFRYFRFPMDFGNFVYLSQVQQGLAIRTAVESWRSLKPHCMGALYWQLNDTWPVASWSGLDHGGGWKALHFMARRFFAPVAVFVIPDKETGDLIVTGINDGPVPAEVEVELSFVTPEGKVTALPPLRALLPTERAITLSRIAAPDIRHGEILHFSHAQTGGEAVRSHFATESYKALSLRPPNLRKTVSRADGTLRVDLTSDSPAYYVMVETAVPGTYSENVIDLLPGEPMTIVFTPDDPARLDEAMIDLIIRDLHSSSSSPKRD
jgi:beta-mannosidase